MSLQVISTKILDPGTTIKAEYNDRPWFKELQNIESKCNISIIIPVFNEESKISAVLTHVKEILNESLLDYEILVVNDGSVDKSLQVIQEEEKLDSRVKVLSYEQNRGKGYAVKQGVVQSNGDVVLFLDGDFNISPIEIKDYVKQLEGCDLVIASKAHPLSTVSGPASRLFLSKMFNLLVRSLIPIKIYDTQSGLKVGNGSVLRRIFEIMLVQRYAFDVELLAIATKLDLKIKELPIRITLDNSFDIREVAKMFIDILGISYRLRITRYYQRSVPESQIK
jgi:glycosyltransferase involved in cell wall biosynthesis